MFKLILTADLMDLINISYFVPNELLQQKSIQSIPPPAASRFETWEEPEESEELKLEMEEIFGSSKVEEKEKEKEKKKKKKDDVFEEKMDEVIKLDDSSDLNHSNNCADAEEEDSPMLCRRVRNPRRNFLLTQSTPVTIWILYKSNWIQCFVNLKLITIGF